ncbi:phage tail protein, partial [Pseudomonas putida]|uniref:phage tail protein n=1 Tax=Pseudomonas putida TaxID=303 RepID=UPI0004CE4601
MVDQTSQFYAILTNIGAAKQANADALGIPWTFAQMAIGDGDPTGLENPPLPMPTASQTALLNEWRRAPLNQLKVDPNNAAVIIAEQIIPADVGGKWIREIALYDADGDMVAVANCPPTFKPLLTQGSGRTQVVRLNLIVSNSSNVQLKIDPSVVLATREWVTEELAKQDFKHSVVAATTAAINLSGLQTVDGVVLTAGARVLVKNQAAAKDNGLYLVVAGGAWTRCTDADSSAKVTPGMLVLVERGTVNGDSAWQLLTNAPITLGVTELAFDMAFGRTGVAEGTYRSVTVDKYGRVVAATNPSTVAGYGLTDVYTKTQIDQALALKAPLNSPVFTGAPKVPTVAAGNSSELAANTAFVMTAIAQLVASSPAALDT